MSRRWVWTLVLFTMLALPAPALADHAGPLAAQWHLDTRQGGENETTPDSSGHGLNATNVLSDALPIFPGGRFGNYLGTSPGAVSPVSSPLLRPQRVTLLGWVRKDGSGGIQRYVAGQGDDGLTCQGGSYALYTGNGASDGLRFYIRPTVGNAQVSPPAGNAIWDDNWHLVAGVYDGSRVRLYVDGIQQGAGTPVPNATINYGFSGNSFYIHEYPISSCGAWNFTGDVDELRVYRRALSSTEIARLAAAGPNPPTLVPDAPGVPLPQLPALATPRFVTTKAVKLSRATWLSGAVSTVPAGVKIANYDWDFNGDGRYDGTCGGDTPAASHPFRRAGSHRVGLRLTDQYGRTSVTTRAVTVTSAQRNLAKAAVFTCEDPATKGNQPDRKDCVKTFSFSIIEVNGRGAADQCFTVKSRSPFLTQKASSSQAAERDRDTRVYNAKIAGPVALNGLPIPVPRQRLTEYDSGNATISAGNVPVKILMPIPGSTPVTLANVPFEYTIKPTKGRVKLPPLKGSGKLPVFGGLKLGGGIEVHLLKHSAEVFMSLRLPEIFKFSNDRVAEGRVTLRTTNAKGFQFEGLRISGIPQVFLGPLYVSNLFFDYQKTGEVWRGGANFQLAAVSPVEIKAAPPPPDYGFGLRGGRFAYAGGGIGFPNPPRPQIFPGVGLVEIGGAIGIDPIRFTGRMAIDVGGFIVVDGSAFIGLANESQPYNFPEEFAPPGLGFLAGRKLDTVSIGIGGEAKIKVPIVGEVPLINSYVFYQYPAYAEFGGGFKFNVAERFSVDGNVGGFAAPIQRTFNLEGDVKGCVDIEITKFCLNVGAVVSSKGIGFCTIVPIPISPFGPTVPVPAGVGYTWGGSIEPKVFSCDTGPYKEARPSARSAQSGSSFILPGGLPSAMVKVTGRGGVPRVELRGPKGERILAPQDDRSRVRNDVVVIPQTPEKRLLIGIKKPSAGRWTVTARPGSASIAGVASANGLGAPRIKARVRGRGRKRLLSYRITPAAGQRVTFFEKGVRTYRRLGVARGRRGRIRFAPASGRRGRREIVAQIERNGVVVKNLVVARFAVARDPRPSRPRRLRVRRRGDSLVIAWRRSRAAFRYGVTVQLSNRRRIFRVTRRRKITIRGVDRRARGTVFVGALRADGVGGREAERRIPKPKRTRRRAR